MSRFATIRVGRRRLVTSGRVELRALVVILSTLHGAAAAAQDTPMPAVQVQNVRRVFHNGQHNAFTDLCLFEDRYYLTFRSCPDGHGVHPTASIIVLSSSDTMQWRSVLQFSVDRRDTRDPHFLLLQDKLFVYTGTWYCGDTSPQTYEMNQHLGYGVWSKDGQTWHGPTMLEGTYGHYVWRAAAHAGKAYLCGRRKRRFADAPRSARELLESVMLESDDGLIFKKRALFQETWGDETAFLFEQDGRVVAVARRGSRKAQLLRSPPPYTQWQRRELDRYIGGPLLAMWHHRYVVGGRKTLGGQAKTSLYWLLDDRLHEFAQLPSGGDNSYPGFVQLSPSEALVSWYSSHEQDAAGKTATAIYLAKLKLAE